MGFDAERAEELADMHSAGVMNLDGSPVDEGFDSADDFDAATTEPMAEPVKKADPMRPEPSHGRYRLPNPETGKSTSWQRVTNFIKMSDDTYHLELWKQRNVAKGLALMIQTGRLDYAQLERLSKADVKLERERINNICSAAQDAAEAYKNADEGTALHTSTELCDYAGGDLNRVPVHHRTKVRMYLDALAAHGITILPDLIERVTVSVKYMVAGKFDRIVRLPDGSNVILDLKTGDSIDLALPGISAQLEAYEDGVNTHGIWDGQRYDTSIKVRDDFALVVHLPSTRDEVSVEKVHLDSGRVINQSNLTVQAARRIKAKHVSEPFQASAYGATQAELDAYWLERLNASHTVAQMADVAARAKSFGQWNERLSRQAYILAAELRAASLGMGS